MGTDQFHMFEVTNMWNMTPIANILSEAIFEKSLPCKEFVLVYLPLRTYIRTMFFVNTIDMAHNTVLGECLQAVIKIPVVFVLESCYFVLLSLCSGCSLIKFVLRFFTLLTSIR